MSAIMEENDDLELQQCVICLYEVMKGENYRVLEGCKHGFHLQCIDAWLQGNSSCPLCRHPVFDDSLNAIDGGGDDHHHHHSVFDVSWLVGFLEHFLKWFVNPLGFDDDEQRCDHVMID